MAYKRLLFQSGTMYHKRIESVYNRTESILKTKISTLLEANKLAWDEL